MQRNRNKFFAVGECKLIPPLWIRIQHYCAQFNQYLLTKPATALIGICQSEQKLCSNDNNKTFIKLFIVALFIIIQNWK